MAADRHRLTLIAYDQFLDNVRRGLAIRARDMAAHRCFHIPEIRRSIIQSLNEHSHADRRVLLNLMRTCRSAMEAAVSPIYRTRVWTDEEYTATMAPNCNLARLYYYAGLIGTIDAFGDEGTIIPPAEFDLPALLTRYPNPLRVIYRNDESHEDYGIEAILSRKSVHQDFDELGLRITAMELEDIPEAPFPISTFLSWRNKAGVVTPYRLTTLTIEGSDSRVQEFQSWLDKLKEVPAEGEGSPIGHVVRKLRLHAMFDDVICQYITACRWLQDLDIGVRFVLQDDRTAHPPMPNERESVTQTLKALKPAHGFTELRSLRLLAHRLEFGCLRALRSSCPRLRSVIFQLETDQASIPGLSLQVDDDISDDPPSWSPTWPVNFVLLVPESSETCSPLFVKHVTSLFGLETKVFKQFSVKFEQWSMDFGICQCIHAWNNSYESQRLALIASKRRRSDQQGWKQLTAEEGELVMAELQV